eukprot:6183342-Pleurochrysis_carterae.AAC.1
MIRLLTMYGKRQFTYANLPSYGWSPYGSGWCTRRTRASSASCAAPLPRDSRVPSRCGLRRGTTSPARVSRSSAESETRAEPPARARSHDSKLSACERENC